MSGPKKETTERSDEVLDDVDAPEEIDDIDAPDEVADAVTGGVMDICE